MKPTPNWPGNNWPGHLRDKVVSWLRLRPDSLFWQWNTFIIPKDSVKGSQGDVVGTGGIAGRWSLACDTICTLRLVHYNARYDGWGNGLFYAHQQGRPETVEKTRPPADSVWARDSVRQVYAGLGSNSSFAQQVYVYKVTLVDQQLSLIEVDRQLGTTPGMSAERFEWIQNAVYKRE